MSSKFWASKTTLRLAGSLSDLFSFTTAYSWEKDETEVSMENEANSGMREALSIFTVEDPNSVSGVTFIWNYISSFFPK